LVLGVLAVILLVLAIRRPRAAVAVPPASATTSGQVETTGVTPPPDEGPADTEA
jgi:hypothetical protein